MPLITTPFPALISATWVLVHVVLMARIQQTGFKLCPALFWYVEFEAPEVEYVDRSIDWPVEMAVP